MNHGGRDPGGAVDVSRRPTLADWRPGSRAVAPGRDDVHAWLVELDLGLSCEEVETAEPGPELDVLADDERARAVRFVRARDRRRFVRCRSALRQILGDILSKPPGSIRFKAAAKGKPELDHDVTLGGGRDNPAALRFNVSHSSELGLIGVCWGRELGVDIEHVRPITEADRIVASFFSPSELSEFAAIAPQRKATAFMRGWTRKEAILKGLGVGIAGLAAEYETGFGTTELGPAFSPATPAPQVKGWRLWEAAPRAEFVAALAIKDE
jgi:4'-phosphopantetheinyl transferase